MSKLFRIYGEEHAIEFLLNFNKKIKPLRMKFMLYGGYIKIEASFTMIGEDEVLLASIYGMMHVDTIWNFRVAFGVNIPKYKHPRPPKNVKEFYEYEAKLREVYGFLFEEIVVTDETLPFELEDAIKSFSIMHN